jgi:hypothetical protein
MELIGEILVAVLAFIGAYLGTKRLKRHLIDNYIEDRVLKAQNVNDEVLSKARNILSSFEQTYTENKPISEEELNNIIKQCENLSKMAEDGGKEVSSVSYLLYQTVKELKPKYEGINSFENITLGDIIYFVNSSLRLIIYYCTTSAPIPFKTRLKKKSVIKRGYQKYLNDKKFYGLKHQPFGLILNPNSEVILRYSEIIKQTGSSIFSRNFYLFLQDNIPVAYQMIAKKIYMPLIIENKQKVPGLFFDRTYLHLIKIQEIISYGEDSGNFVKFYYSNLNPVFIFVKNMKDDKIKSEFTNDVFIESLFNFDENYQFEKKLNETIEIKVKLEKVQKNYKEKEQALKRKLRKYKSNY